MPLPEDVVADDPRYASEHPSHHNQIHAAINDLEALAGTLSDVETSTGAQGKVDTHALDTTSVHGISDTAQLPAKNAVNTYTLEQRALRVIVKESPVDARHPDFGGLDLTGVTDATATLTAAIAALPTLSSRKLGELRLPQGRLKVSGTLAFHNADTLHVRAERGCRLAWAGNASDPMFRVSASRRTVFENFDILADTSVPLATAVQLETHSDRVQTDVTFRDISIDGTNGGVGKGFHTKAGTGGDNNNDYMQFYRVLVANFSDTAWHFEHTQSKAHILVESVWNSNSFGDYGIRGQASFQAIGCGGGNCKIADFSLSPNDGVTVVGGNFEGSDRFLSTTGPGSSALPFYVHGARWSNDGVNADNKAILYQYRGPLTLVNCNFDGLLDQPIELNVSSGGPVAWNVQGCRILSSLTEPLTGTTKPFAMGNRRETSGSGGATIEMADWVNTLKANVALISQGNVTSQLNNAEQVRIGGVGPADQAGVSFSGSADLDGVKLYREASNVLSVEADTVLKTGRNVTGSRPTASAAGAGAMFYDTTLGKPVWSDATVWRDAAGTAV